MDRVSWSASHSPRGLVGKEGQQLKEPLCWETLGTCTGAQRPDGKLQQRCREWTIPPRLHEIHFALVSGDLEYGQHQEA